MGYLVLVHFLVLGWVAQAPAATEVAYLAQVMDQFHLATPVYTDQAAAGNHFVARGKMSSPGNEAALPPMDEGWTTNPHSGLTCIRAEFRAQGDNWGGWYFLNGVLRDTEVAPRPNWGEEPAAGVDLSGATALTFWVRGDRGGEVVEFFVAGVGRDPSTGLPITPYPDSAPKISLGFVTLTPEWRQYTIDLRGKNLSYVLGGFGWVTNAMLNGGRDIVFYVDDIVYHKARLQEPRFLLSYQTLASGRDFDRVMRNAAFVYDNAVALLAFLAAGERQRAKLVADALVYALDHDRYYTDGRLRNAYQAGDLALPPGWTPNGRVATVRMPGWYDQQANSWCEDRFAVSSHTGNLAWAMLALLSYYETCGGLQYLAAAQRLGQWIVTHCYDPQGPGGYTGGYDGWEPNPTKLTYKATEHNLDVMVAFQRLYQLTGDDKWRQRAEHARNFVLAMWDANQGKFWTGTYPDGVTINKEVIPLDIQAWALLALRQDCRPYQAALTYAEQYLQVGSGFDFNQDRDGVWYEGTAQMATAYRWCGQNAKWQACLLFLQGAQAPDGGLWAADRDGLTTGFDWLYFRRLHVGATAWLALAHKSVNPFWLGTPALEITSFWLLLQGQ